MIPEVPQSASGFTLVELLITVSIISMLASVVIVNVQGARTRAGIAKYMAELNSIRTALVLYENTHDSVPCYPTGCQSGDFNGNTSYETTLTPLVTDTLISKIPHFPGWTPSILGNPFTGTWGYTYYFLGTDSSAGAATEYFCGSSPPYSSWTPVSAKPVLVIATGAQTILPYQKDVYQCTAGSSCGATIYVSDSIRTYYCLNLL
jgi:prepilin-type N-terminal cleavage/methylation domain-containing protein